MGKVKIVVFTRSLSAGGAEKQAIQVANLLSKEYKVKLIAFSSSNFLPRYREKVLNERINFTCLNGNLILKFIHFLKEIFEFKPDFIFNFLFVNNFFSSILKLLNRKTKVVGSLRSSKIFGIKFVIMNFLARNVFSNTIVNSKSGLEYFKREGFPVENLVFIPNTISMRSVNQSIDKNPYFNILTVARLVEVKDLHTSIKAVNNFRKDSPNTKIRYDIVGDGPLIQDLKLFSTELDISDIVFFHGRCSNVADFYSKADVFLLSSLREGMSNSIMEAMSFSLPIICTNVGDNNQLVNHGKNGYLCKVRDYKSISSSLKIISHFKSIRTKFGKKSSEIINDHFSDISVTSKYDKIIKFNKK